MPDNQRPVRTLLADDHAMVRAGLRQLLEHTGLVKIVAEADDGTPVPDLIASENVGLAILDISMPRLGGLDLLPILRNRFPLLRTMVLSMHANVEYVREALQRGANGFLPKDAPPEELRTALRQVTRGECYVAPSLVPALAGLRSPARDPEQQRLETLPPRQRQLLGLVGQGHSTREIAVLLGISVKTVETHRARLMRSLSLRHNNDLIRYAAQQRSLL